MLGTFNPLILDVVVVALLLLFILFGALKGFKHTMINFILLLGAVMLSFTNITNGIKLYIVELLSSFIELGVGINDEIKLAFNFSYIFIAGCALTLLIYVILRLFKIIVFRLIKKSKIKRNKLISPPKGVSRFFGGLFSLIFNGVFLVVLLSLFNTSFIGGNKSIKYTYVAKHVENVDEFVIDNIDIIDIENHYEEKLLIKLILADFFVEVKNIDIVYFIDFSDLINKGSVYVEELDDVQNNLDFLHGMLLFMVNYTVDEKGQALKGFEGAVDIGKNIANKAINNLNNLNKDNELIVADKTLAISNLLKKVGMEDTAKILESTFVVK